MNIVPLMYRGKPVTTDSFDARVVPITPRYFDSAIPHGAPLPTTIGHINWRLMGEAIFRLHTLEYEEKFARPLRHCSPFDLECSKKILQAQRKYYGSDRKAC